MPDWQERITRETKPSLRAEHDLRYRLAAPLIRQSAAWLDLGCGNGVAAADALGSEFAGRAVLVDVEQSAVDAAAGELRRLGTSEISALSADLTDPEALSRIREELLRGDESERVITCFEVVEHLTTFVPLVEMLSALAEDGLATVLLSVPNDAFWTIDNPHHVTMWSEGAFDELRRLLPAGAIVCRQIALNGSAIVPLAAEEGTSATLSVTLDAAHAVPSHFIAAMGPRAGAVGVHAEVVQSDLDEQRRWERAREADLAYFQELVETWRPWFEEFRAYIHDLEGRLGLPLTGVDPQTLPSGEPTGGE